MRKWMVNPARMVAGGLLLAVILSGCTLSGAAPVPVTPVGDTGSVPTQEATQESLPATPTEAGPIDVFGTQTAQAPSPLPPVPTATEEGGAVEVPTQEATLEPTPTPEVPGTGATSATCPPTHTVQAGENLFRIALQYGLTTEQLAAANGITNPAAISVGTVLSIPGCQTGPVVVNPPDGTSGNTASGNTHVVQEGENLYRIALQYGLTWQQLAEANGISNPNSVFVGQVLRIP